MNILKLYHKLFCVMQWSIGFSRGDIRQIIKNKKSTLQFKWLELQDKEQSIADPFIFKDDAGGLRLLYEDFSMRNTARYGKIVHSRINSNFEAFDQKLFMDAGSHLSYPMVYTADNTTYIIPESSHQNKVSRHKFDFESNLPVDEEIIMEGHPLLDSTIVEHNGKYWLFATHSTPEEFEHSRLYIYHADKPFGPYLPHAKNAVKENNDGSRPAGNFIVIDGELFRPAQNCSIHYGESITINKVTKLSETDFEEEFWFKIAPDQKSQYSSGIHTINVVDDIIVVDGIKMTFAPFTKWILFFRKKFGKRA